MKYSCKIKNEKGQVIFSRKGNFKNKQEALSTLHKEVCVDVPSKYSLVYNMMYGGSFEDSPYCLKRYYTDISKLTFYVDELN
jgi:hypothetical protein